AALAAVLLTLVQHADEATLDRLDLLGVFRLSFPHLQRTAACRADVVGVVEHVSRLEQRQRGLRPRTMARLFRLDLTWAFRAAFLAALTERHSITDLELMLELGNIERELLRLLALKLANAALERDHLRDQLAILGIENPDRLMQHRGVWISSNVTGRA